MPADDFDSHREPDEIFLPLSSERYCRFYDLEMAEFQSDLPFYLERIKAPCSVLELGCGTGRLCRPLAATGAEVTGVDLNPEMLRRARLKTGPKVTYLCMDMSEPAINRSFDAVLIPYHTLNLLRTEERIAHCLHQTRKLLTREGKLLLQLFIPDQTLLALGTKKLFQFQIFEEQNGGRIIKEVRRSYSHEQLVLEERYRIRPGQPGESNEDLSHTLHLAAFSFDKWQLLLHRAGFTICRHYGGYDLTPFVAGQDSCLFVQAEQT